MNKFSEINFFHRMYGLAVIVIMSLSGHLSNIDDIIECLQIFHEEKGIWNYGFFLQKKFQPIFFQQLTRWKLFLALIRLFTPYLILIHYTFQTLLSTSFFSFIPNGHKWVGWLYLNSIWISLANSRTKGFFWHFQTNSRKALLPL